MLTKRPVPSDMYAFCAVAFSIDNNAKEFRHSFDMDDRRSVLMSLSLV